MLIDVRVRRIIALTILATSAMIALGFVQISPASASLNATKVRAIEIPGIAALNTGSSSPSVFSVSCASAGNCGADGQYAVGTNQYEAFVVNEVGGTWGRAVEIPGIAALNTGRDAVAFSVSCASAGNCSAGGEYSVGTNQNEAFVVNEVGGTWGRAIEIPGIAALNTGKDANVDSVSCASAGNCSAGGEYAIRKSGQEAFVVNEVGGKWGRAIEVPGTATLNGGRDAVALSVSCASAANCSAVGRYRVGKSKDNAFVVNEVGGKWGRAIEVPGTAALNRGEFASVDSVSCASAGNCSAGGEYSVGTNQNEAFVVNEVGGTWGRAIEIPGIAALNTGKDANVDSVSCASAGNCSAGGEYAIRKSGQEAFVVNEVGGKWGRAIEVPGTAALNRGEFASVDSVSCASAGNCSAGGNESNKTGFLARAFVVNEVGGKWGRAIEIPGIATLAAGGSTVMSSVSCVSSVRCIFVGDYGVNLFATQ